MREPALKRVSVCLYAQIVCICEYRLRVSLCARRNVAVSVCLEKLSVCLSVCLWSKHRHAPVPDKTEIQSKTATISAVSFTHLHVTYPPLVSTFHSSPPSPHGFSFSSISSVSFNEPFLPCRPAHMPHGQVQVQEQPLHPSALAV